MIQVILREDDTDTHEDGCQCGLCNSVNWKSYGVGIFEVGEDDPLERVYAPSFWAARHNALMLCEENCWAIASEVDK